MSGPPGTRSLSGCHTCRLRKKKCDETHPVCMNCSSRGIPCYGYGMRPAWMDGAGQEAEYVRIIKKAAERNYRARRRGWRASVSGGNLVLAGSANDMPGRDVMVEKLTTSNEQIWTEGQFTAEEIRAGNLSAKEWDTGAVSGQLIPGWDEEDLQLAAPDWNPLGGIGSGYILRQDSQVDEEESDLMVQMAFPSRNRSYPAYYTAILESQSPHILSSASNLPSLTSSSCSQSVSLQSSIPSPPTTAESIWWGSNFAPSYSVRNKTELGLLTHYLDNVFGLQFGFSALSNPDPADDPARSCYLDMLLRCRPLYFATLSISALHRQIMSAENFAALWAPTGDDDWRRTGRRKGNGSSRLASGESRSALNLDAERNFVMALKGLQGVLSEMQGQHLRGLELLRSRWQILGSISQVLSLEVFRTLGGNWPIHIKAARKFLSMIGCSSFPSPTPFPNPTCTSYAPEKPQRLDILEQILSDDRHQILTTNETTTLRHVVTSLIWVDILSRASGIDPTAPAADVEPDAPSLHPSPSQQQQQTVDYLPLLENRTLDLRLVMGCENWVFITLTHIIALESDLITHHRRLAGHHSHYCTPIPSNPKPDDDVVDDEELQDHRRRATVLEVCLERGIRDLLSARERIASTTAPLSLQDQSSLITELFALAALTYLHTIVSGAHSSLPQIRNSVSRALAALVALPPELLIRVSWPFTIVGCMVLTGEEREMVRSVVERAANGGWNVGTCAKGMFVMEECWRLREEWEKRERGVVGEARGGEGGGIGWVHAMHSLGVKILLC